MAIVVNPIPVAATKYFSYFALSNGVDHSKIQVEIFSHVRTLTIFTIIK